MKRLLVTIGLLGLFLGIMVLEWWGFIYHNKATIIIFGCILFANFFGLCYFWAGNIIKSYKE